MKGHFKTLSKEDMAKYVSKYSFELKGDTILTYSLGRDGSTRVVGHEFGKNFVTSLKGENGNPSQNMIITGRAQKFWKDYFLKYNLGEIQNVINELYLKDQLVNSSTIKGLLD